jgi:hypothetical protein
MNTLLATSLFTRTIKFPDVRSYSFAMRVLVAARRPARQDIFNVARVKGISRFVVMSMSRRCQRCVYISVVAYQYRPGSAKFS